MRTASGATRSSAARSPASKSVSPVTAPPYGRARRRTGPRAREGDPREPAPGVEHPEAVPLASLPAVSPTPLGSAAEVLLATGHDPFVRSSLRRPGVAGWHHAGATLWFGTDPEEGTSYVMTHGAPPAVAELVGELLEELPARARITLPRGTAPLLPAWVGIDGADWDFRWTTVAPPTQPGEADVVVLTDDGEVAELLAAASPAASALPGDPAVRRWLGLREQGTLVATAADTSATTGVGHLSSIAVHPDARGRGLAKAVTAALTRRLLADGCDLVTLGMYADNTPARRVYDALGFADDHRFTSGPLQVRGRC